MAGKIKERLARWTQRHPEPPGTVPRHFQAKLFIGIGAVLVAGLIIITQSKPRETSLPGVETEADPDAPPPGTESGIADPSAVAAARGATEAAAQRLAAEAERRKQQAQEEAEHRAEQEREMRKKALAKIRGEVQDLKPGEITEADLELEALKQQLEIEEYRLRHEALRSPVVAQSARGPDDRIQPLPGSDAGPPAPAEERQEPQGIQPAADPLPAAEPYRMPAPPAPIQPTPRPNAPPGFYLVDGGQWIEAALSTQIRGDFPGPVIARATAPFYTRDRQHVVIPRGARFIGTAGAVSGSHQARLAVTFSRLQLPSGHSVRLDFTTLNQSGETGLKDKVNNHYIAAFGSAAAVGVLAGFTQRDSREPSVGGIGSPRYHVGQEFGQLSASILDRFLNRLPTITIRAGHRLRIYFATDILLPLDSERAAFERTHL